MTDHWIDFNRFPISIPSVSNLYIPNSLGDLSLFMLSYCLPEQMYMYIIQNVLAIADLLYISIMCKILNLCDHLHSTSLFRVPVSSCLWAITFVCCQINDQNFAQGHLGPNFNVVKTWTFWKLACELFLILAHTTPWKRFVLIWGSGQ